MPVPPVSSSAPNTHFEPVSGHRSPSIPSTLVSLQASKEEGSCLSALFRPFVKFFNWILSLFCPAKEPDGAGKPKIEGLPEEIDIQGTIMLTNGHLFKYLVALSAPEDSPLYFPRDSNHLLATRETLVGYMDVKEVNDALFNDKICFFPMREGFHWRCVIINPTEQTIGYYDSKGTGRAIPDFLQDINGHLDIDYALELPTPRSIQPDGFQCGIWILYFLHCVSRGAPIDDDVDIAAFRDEVQQVLIRANSQRDTNLARIHEEFDVAYAEANSLELSGIRPDIAFEALTQSLVPYELELGLLRGALPRAGEGTTQQ